MLKMHSLCRRVQMQLVFQTTHLAVAGARLKSRGVEAGVERGRITLKGALESLGLFEGSCQKSVIAFAVPSIVLKRCRHTYYQSWKSEASIVGTSNWIIGIPLCLFLLYFLHVLFLWLVASPSWENKGDGVSENQRLGWRSAPCCCGESWTWKRVNRQRQWLQLGGNLPVWQQIRKETKRYTLKADNLF